MTNQRPIGITLIAIFIAWGIVNTISRIFLRSDSADITILNHYNAVWIGYLLAIVILALSVAALFSIFKKKKWGTKILYGVFLLNTVFTLSLMILASLDFEVAKNAYIESRMSRGLSADNIDMMISPAATALMAAAYTLFYSILAFYVHKKREFFTE